MSQFFPLLTKGFHKYKFPPDRVSNCDETGISVVRKTKSKVISRNDRKQVSALTSAEKGTTATVEVCLHAGVWTECHPSGWMQTDIFSNWFKKFVALAGATRESPVLLLLDSHHTHTKNREVIDYAKQHGVVLLRFPPHCSHRLQPLDVSFMKPLSVFYDAEVSAWLRTDHSRVVSVFQIAKLFENAFIKTATIARAIT